MHDGQHILELRHKFGFIREIISLQCTILIGVDDPRRSSMRIIVNELYDDFAHGSL